MKTVYLSLGSNIGNRAENILSALSFLQSSNLIDIIKVSSFFETSAVGFKQRNFYNITAEIRTNLTPDDLLSVLKQAEIILGRKPSKRWGPRTIDIDILFYGRQIIKQGNLVVPHKEIQNRLFVLCPLAEISPDLTHPVLNRKINEILKKNRLTHSDQKVKIIKAG